MTETPQSGNFRGKGNSQRLTKSKKFAFGNSQFTRQHNISLSGTNKYTVLGLVTCHLNQSNMLASAGQSCCFEQLVLND